jgi:hypothetical protein
MKKSENILSFLTQQMKFGWRKDKTCSVSWPNKLKLDEEKTKHTQFFLT